MRDEGAIYVAGHPLLNRCSRLPECIRLRNDLYCAGWGLIKRYLLCFFIRHRPVRLGRYGLVKSIASLPP